MQVSVIMASSAVFAVLDAVLPNHLVDGIAKQLHAMRMQDVWRDPSMQLARAFTQGGSSPTEQLHVLRAFYPGLKEHVYHGRTAPLETMDAVMDAMDFLALAHGENPYRDLIHINCFLPFIVIWEISRTHFIMYVAAAPSAASPDSSLFHIGEYIANENAVSLIHEVTKATGVWKETDVYDAMHFLRACMPHLCLHHTHSILRQLKAKEQKIQARALLPKPWLMGPCILEAVRAIFGH